MQAGALPSWFVDRFVPEGVSANLIRHALRVDASTATTDFSSYHHPPRMPTTPHPAVCRTLLTDGQTRCSALLKPGRQSCRKHAPAYDASYERYKRAEEAAEDLRAAAQTKRGDVLTIPSEEIKPRIKSVRAYIKALESELWLRKEHDVRFIGNREYRNEDRVVL